MTFTDSCSLRQKEILIYYLIPFLPEVEKGQPVVVILYEMTANVSNSSFLTFSGTINTLRAKRIVEIASSTKT
jgi:hypothetical protein